MHFPRCLVLVIGLELVAGVSCAQSLATDLDYIVLETGASAEVVSSALATSAYLPNDANSQWIWEYSSGWPN